MCACVCVCSSVVKTLWVQAFSSSGRPRPSTVALRPPEGERSETRPGDRCYVCWEENANELVLKVRDTTLTADGIHQVNVAVNGHTHKSRHGAAVPPPPATQSVTK